MKKLIMIFAALAMLSSLMFVGTADAVGPVTPLSEEPVSLHVDGNQQVTDHAHIPKDCSVTTDRVGVASCIEVISDWICPAGFYGRNPLSADAKARFSPSYNDAIQHPVTPRAYLDTHCLLLGTRPRPVPTATIACAAHQVVSIDSSGKLICIVVITAPTATPVVVPPNVVVPRPGFTG